MLNHLFRTIVKYKRYIMTLLIIILINPILTSCNKNESTACSMFKDLLNISYENCLICHMGGNNPITHHCVMYQDISITQCVQCHKKKHDGNILPGMANVDCADCHAY